MDDRRFRTDRGGDPIAELARLIAQADTHDGSVPSDNRSREEPVSIMPFTPPRRSIGIVKSLLTQLRRSIRIMKFRACAGTG